jgi:hypothetical protein
LRVLRRPEEQEETAVVLLAVHHLVSDFASLAVMVRELATLYAEERGGPRAVLERPAATYADFVRWQASLLASPEGERQERFWRQRLAGELPVLDLPADRPRPPVQTDRGGAVALRLAGAPCARLKDLGRRRGATLYMTLLAAFQVLLHRYTQEEDVLVGSPTAGRGAAALADVVGYFVNPLVLRSDLSEDLPFTALLDRVRRTALDAFAHRDLPFPLLAEELQPVRDPSRSPIFQVLFVLQPSRGGAAPLAGFALGQPGARMAFADLSLEPFPLAERRAQYDLTVMAAELESEGELAATFEYNADLFDRPTIERLAANFVTLLQGIGERPEETLGALPLLAASERAQLLHWSGDSVRAAPSDLCLHELVLAQAARTPAAEAIVGRDERLTYAELAPHLMSSWVTDATGLFDDRPRSSDFRFVLACAGVLGIGADITRWSPGDRAAAAAWIGRYQRVREVITLGDVHQIGGPEQDRCAVQYSLGERVVVLAWSTGRLDGLGQVPGRDLRLPLRGLEPGARYRRGEATYSGVHLMAAGLPVRWTPEHDAEMIELTRT